MKKDWLGPLWASALALTLTPLAASASSSDLEPRLGAAVLASSYQIGDQDDSETVTNNDATPADDSTASQGPVRLARFSYVKGSVTWRPAEDADWSDASVNLPLRQGAQVWVTNGGRAEVQFDDGSLLRLGNGAVVTLQTLYSDADGEFTEIKMNEGLCTLVLKHGDSIYQVDTPFASVKSVGPSKVRVGVDENVEVAVRSGSAVIEGSQGKQTVSDGQYLDIADADATYQVSDIPDPDTWDQWNDSRDSALADADSAGRLPADIALVAGDLDDYGTWHNDPQYGAVWCPTVVDTGWRPYEHGHWVWVEPFGWTWVSSEAWGWAPYHYGAWVDESYGWAWVPGPATQYWSPAVVNFCEYNGSVAWVPLAPREVRYPSVLSIGFHSGDWSLFFSIGGAAVYYPENDQYCAARPWNNRVVNRATYVNNITTVNRNVYLADNHFVPLNARNADGVTSATVDGFAGRGAYQPQPRAAGFFERGRGIGAPERGVAPVAGPMSVRPTLAALTPSRTFSPAGTNAAVLQRPVFRSNLPARVARVAPAIPPQQMTTFRGRPSQTDRLPGSQAGINTGPGPRLPDTQAPLTDRERARQDALAARASVGQPSPGYVPDRRATSDGFRGGRTPGQPGGSGNGRTASHSYRFNEGSTTGSGSRSGRFRDGSRSDDHSQSGQTQGGDSSNGHHSDDRTPSR